MRYRRAERCVARAEEALAAGREDDARIALAEANALNPDTPVFDDMAAAVHQRAAAAAAAKRAERHRVVAAAVFVSLVMAAGALGWWFRASSRGDDNTAVAATTGAPTTPSASASSPAPPAPIPQAPVRIASETTTPDVTESPVRTSGAVATPPAVTAPLTVPESPPAQRDEPALPPVESVAPSVTLERPTTAGATESSINRVSGPDGLVGNLPSAALPVLTLPPPRAEAAAEPKPVEPPAVSEESKVRTVLAQFEAAYTRLSASEAQAVWPSVDARALAEAFNSLAAQRVSLGRCAIVINGPAARADCSGTASWTPKIGGGRRTQSRRWEFDLVSENGSWQILQAIAR